MFTKLIILLYPQLERCEKTLKGILFRKLRLLKNF